MKKYTKYIFSFIHSALAFVGFFVVLVIVTGTYRADHLYERNEEFVQNWLQDLEVSEDKNFTAGKLRELCKLKSQSDEGFCVGYMLGFVEGSDVSYMTPFCTRGSLRSAEQTIQAFENFMTNNPQHWEKSRAPILGASLQASFPCNTVN